jgi:signal transduction histidine kinase
LTPTDLKFNLDLPLVLPQWKISSEIRHNLYLAFKEALNNAVKHAHATEVVVSLATKADSFVLSVKDNGCGFDPAKPDVNGGRGRGNGLNNMRRRLEELGGTCVITSRAGEGTQVSFEVKLSS